MLAPGHAVAGQALAARPLDPLRHPGGAVAELSGLFNPLRLVRRPGDRGDRGPYLLPPRELRWLRGPPPGLPLGGALPRVRGPGPAAPGTSGPEGMTRTSAGVTPRSGREGVWQIGEDAPRPWGAGRSL